MNGQQMTIMVVDDNAGMRAVMKDTLSAIPCSIVECSTGAEAVERYNALRPDGVLMDVMMEPMNGIAALLKIKESNPHAKIIVVSGSHEDSVGAASLKAGAFAFVKKESMAIIPELIQQET